MVTLDMIRKPVEGDLEAFEQFIRQKFTADGTLLSRCSIMRSRRGARGFVR